MRTTKQRIEYLFELRDKDQIAEEIENIIDDAVSDIAVRLESEFHYYLPGGIFVASSCYVSPPGIGQSIKIKDSIYKIHDVIHAFNSSQESGKIIVEKLI
ncbi:hypothetical protein MKJ01_05425 [Chryseobacterium sp. SSA4.19]|uniref:hypothetical protein n=1 Tax=Chryseobacterium sp. SSA4.19 TaxID=2919915 RepID=UPI001F4D40AA|nr:hypothetical protein [Chryseobacterium sp. SSA4.19]MCJ8153201.1 hypothetical protein [Chryseobacterium sp. SSA4.19]